jgi:RNA polymerase sigma-19 factor, ECF subfamily
MTKDGKPAVASAIGLLGGAAYREYSEALHRYLVRRLPFPSDISDLAQEVFLRFLRIEDMELIRQPHHYFFGIAANVVREYRMRLKAEKERVVYDSEAVDEQANRPVELPTEDLADELDRTQQLEKALLRLAPMDRAVIVFIKRDGLSYEETAQVTGLTYYQVEKYYFRALAQLRKMAWDR